jgi:Ser/Thr protein kinase RdoA (MazF antagonist)
VPDLPDDRTDLPDDDPGGVLPVLTEDETRAVERVLTSAWGAPVTLAGAEIFWERPHVVRVTAGDGRTAILKRPRAAGDNQWTDEPLALALEWASLELLADMPVAVAPRLLGGDAERSLVLLEELPPGRSLADDLLGDDAAAAEAGFVAYATALAEVHAWSRGRRAAFEDLLRERGRGLSTPPVATPPVWARRVARAADGFGSAAEHGEVVRLLTGDDDRSVFVHGDPCPDNVRITGGRCRIFDFERSSWGSAALDAAYLLAPFPSCWCFGALPDRVAGAARDAYRSAAGAGGLVVDDDRWEAETAAALAAFLIARAHVFATPDQAWGTTTLGPRLVAWADAFLAAPGSAAFPRLVADTTERRDRLLAAATATDPVAYPALPIPGVRTAILDLDTEAPS